jgi:hypothetical protein
LYSTTPAFAVAVAVNVIGTLNGAGNATSDRSALSVAVGATTLK